MKPPKKYLASEWLRFCEIVPDLFSYQHYSALIWRDFEIWFHGGTGSYSEAAAMAESAEYSEFAIRISPTKFAQN